MYQVSELICKVVVINYRIIPAHIPPNKQILLETLASRLSAVSGVISVVLGGSYARGTHHADSDLDLGIYYAEKHPFQIGEIKRIALEVSHQDEPVVTGFYAWGPWVNGGAWIQTSAGKIASFSLCPPNYTTQLFDILARPGRTPQELSGSVKELQALWESVVSLAGKLYKPKWRHAL